MNKLSTILLILVILGIVAGLYISYQMIKAQRKAASLEGLLSGRDQIIEGLTSSLDDLYEHRMVFLHHSVGHGILYSGGLRDSLLDLGIVVRGATYGDEIGQETDMNHWLPKFETDLDRIIAFRAHPNKYYDGGRSNDIIMFKSCFPNSGLAADGSGNGDPTSPEKTVVNYQATFLQLKEKFAARSDKLFLYMTAPPLSQMATTSDEAARAKKFNAWLVEEFQVAYREESIHDNFVVYDLFSFLADDNGYLKDEYRYQGTSDSHPNNEANKAVVADFMMFFRPIWETWRQINAE